MDNPSGVALARCKSSGVALAPHESSGVALARHESPGVALAPHDLVNKTSPQKVENRPIYEYFGIDFQ